MTETPWSSRSPSSRLSRYRPSTIVNCHRPPWLARCCSTMMSTWGAEPVARRCSTMASVLHVVITRALPHGQSASHDLHPRIRSVERADLEPADERDRERLLSDVLGIVAGQRTSDVTNRGRGVSQWMDSIHERRRLMGRACATAMGRSSRRRRGRGIASVMLLLAVSGWGRAGSAVADGSPTPTPRRHSTRRRLRRRCRCRCRAPTRWVTTR